MTEQLGAHMSHSGAIVQQNVVAVHSQVASAVWLVVQGDGPKVFQGTRTSRFRVQHSTQNERLWYSGG